MSPQLVHIFNTIASVSVVVGICTICFVLVWKIPYDSNDD